MRLPIGTSQIEIGNIWVIYARVPHAEFGQEALAKHIKDLAWVTTKAQKHSAIVQMCHLQTSVVPMRFPTIFETWESTRASIAENKAQYTAFLTKIDQKNEWTVRLYAQEDTLKIHLAKNIPALLLINEQMKTAQAGKGFILAKQYEKVLTEAIDAFIAQKAQLFIEAITPQTTEGIEVPLKYPQEDLVAHKIIAKYIFLVDKNQEDAFKNTLEQFHDQLEPQGIAFLYSGAWAIYNFLPHA